MECRENCGICCIVPSINSPIPGMPDGKLPGIPCIHLTKNYSCAIFTNSDRPEFCKNFKAEKIVCGDCRQDAIRILASLEELPLCILNDKYE